MHYEGITEMCLPPSEITNFINGVCRLCLTVITSPPTTELREAARNNSKRSVDWKKNYMLPFGAVLDTRPRSRKCPEETTHLLELRTNPLNVLACLITTIFQSIGDLTSI